MSSSEPLVTLESEGRASVISYNVPEPTSYSGRNFIELGLDDACFVPGGFDKPPAPPPGEGSQGSVAWGSLSLLSGASRVLSLPKKQPVPAGTPAKLAQTTDGDPVTLATTSGNDSVSWSQGSGGKWQVASTVPLSQSAAAADAELLIARSQTFSEVPILSRNLYGTYDLVFVKPPTKPRPRIVLVETYRLSSYLGNYGAGRTIKTFSLFPGEKTTISIKTYKSTESTEKSASSILDSFTEESASEFETAISSEQTSSESSENAKQYSTAADAHAFWGWGAANASASYGGSTQSAREDAAKNITSATEKSASSASAKREVQIETSYEVTETSGEETSIVREFQNINVGRTLNFVFRQMNQEFITFLHLVDVRVAFCNGYAELTHEVTLAELDTLLETWVVAKRRAEVKRAILGELSAVLDHQGVAHNIIEKRTLAGADGKPTEYHRVKREIVTDYVDPATGSAFKVPGVILAVNKYVMRTEGVIVESLLGQAPALDPYSAALQDEAVRAKKLENDRLGADIARVQLAAQIVRDKDSAAAGIYATVFPPPPPDTADGEGTAATTGG